MKKRVSIKNTSIGPIRKNMKRVPIDANWRKAVDQEIKRVVPRMISKKTELKYIDTVIDCDVNNSTVVQDLSIVPQGTTNVTCIGDTILPKRLDVRLYTYSLDFFQVVRIIIFRWKPINIVVIPTQPSYTNIITGSATTFDQVNWGYVVQGRDQFEVLLDTTYSQSGYVASAQATSSSVKSLVKILPLAKKSIEFTNTNGVVGSNKLYMLVLGDQLTPTTGKLKGVVRLNFTDS